MRVYLPATLRLLREWQEAQACTPVDDTAFAVTPALREWYAEGDADELEFAALTEAAGAALRLLADDVATPRRRVVVAADVDESSATPEPTRDRAVVRLAGPVPWRDVAAALVDDVAATEAVSAAADAVLAAELGDDDAQFTVDEAEGHELGWYATQEIGHLAAEA